jgi:adenylate cyclase
MSFSHRYLATALAGNLGGALLTFAYFRFLDPAAMKDLAPMHGSALGYFLGIFALLFFMCRFAARRWTVPVMRLEGPLPNEAASSGLRRRALLVPAFTAWISLAGWAGAALIWGVGWPLVAGGFSLGAALRQVFGTVFVAGLMVAVFIFLATERLWRERLPMLFPDGDLADTGAARLRVRTRLVVLFLLMSILPMTVLSVATLVRANALRMADAETAELILQNLIVVQFVLGGAGVLMAVLVAGYVASSVARPLRHLQEAMARVAQGALDARCPVVSNDELGAVAEGFNRMVGGLREREEMRETFGKYVSPEVRDEILAGRASLDGGLRDVTILFADLRDFTPWVEATPAAEVVSVLNAYFTEMDSAIRAHGGLVLQFIGDEIEAVFGAPVAHAGHADQAVGAALEMQSRLEAWNAGRRAHGMTQLRHGIGIHSGTVVAGNIGSSERMSYTLVGDAVNLASRIQSLNKTYGTRILVSGSTRAMLREPHDFKPLPAAHVKGRAAEVEVFALA